jgi:hypothetical protein
MSSISERCAEQVRRCAVALPPPRFNTPSFKPPSAKPVRNRYWEYSGISESIPWTEYFPSVR